MTKKNKSYKRISKGIHRLPSGNYRVRITRNGTTYGEITNTIRDAKIIYNNIWNQLTAVY